MSIEYVALLVLLHFGEKHGDVVRVVSAGAEDTPFSLVSSGGGTHAATRQTSAFRDYSRAPLSLATQGVLSGNFYGAIEYADERLAHL